MTELNATHDPALRSWVDSANAPQCDFPIQNLPFGRFRPAGSNGNWRIGVAIGDQILDLRAAGLVNTADMNVLMAATPSERSALRSRISEGLRDGSKQRAAWEDCLLAQAQAEFVGQDRIAEHTKGTTIAVVPFSLAVVLAGDIVRDQGILA